ncbi:LOW QUALITY PROTEIN: synaptotagmin-3-like [Numenius arquata]|uniref:LOW QUALITY PROTEIN: synaptotagmin-3-like n=1 Tax=Numenius arquata TaxID=31919 RepID=UPI003D308400
MSGDYEEDVCRSALRLVQELCFAPRARPPHDKCLEFTDLLRHRGHPRPNDTEVSVSLLSVIVTFCGIVLLGVSLFVSWKLCWVPWRHKGGAGAPPRKEPLQNKPDPNPPNLGQIQPELYCPQGDGGDGGGVGGGSRGGSPCGRLSVALRYAYGSQQLVVRVLRALDLPAKDANGFSDPYVKIYLLPDRKKKFQTKVHRKTLNPVFDETFSFGVPLAELPLRRLHFSVYDFDRLTSTVSPRHDLIGQVVLDNLLEATNAGDEGPIWRDILEGSGEKADLGEVNFSLCYLPTAGRLTVTVIRASNLRAMDLTGYSDPYVKASLMAEGRRLKKRKTSIKKNTLNPSYNEALVFDVPHESVHHVSLTIAVVDYDCIGHNEVIGLCRVGSDAEGPGREHWAQMLANPRKPIEHWHTLVEHPQTPANPRKPIEHWHTLVEHPETPANPRKPMEHWHTLVEHPQTPANPRKPMEHWHTLVEHPQTPANPRKPMEHWHTLVEHPQTPANPRKPMEHWHTLVEEKALGLATKGSSRDKPSVVVEPVGPD